MKLSTTSPWSERAKRSHGPNKNVIPSLGIRAKSWGSVRESGDSVECLERYSGAKDARSGKDRLAGHVSERAGALGVCAGMRAGARLCSGSVHPGARSSPEMKKST
ncbi:hypothetical protein CRG98_003648 [Punica granatum]|uniref:Uncharacterized protein n=1 Tax=Punica granatum TaxID=22663 RepID=A0A2I0L5U1_PUNGR|nr:hypothetical protein CRG98_003648 [Punica granatum]